MTAARILGDPSFEPEAAVRRRMLEARRDALRAQGFQIEIEVTSILAQAYEGQMFALPAEAGGGSVPIEQYLERQRLVSDNAYRAARALQGMIDDLPPRETVGR